jgi:hypothetical protein
MNCQELIDIGLKGKNDTPVLYDKDGIKYEINGYEIVFNKELNKNVLVLKHG